MTDIPNPLTPADAELRNFREMPIDVPRLLGSDLVHDESPEACWSAMLLWCVSWHEVPAGSLPDNDEWLAKRAGYWHKGKLDPTWNEVRDGALHGWIKCSDGRLYHPVVAEKVNNAWYSKHRHAHEKLGERLRKRNKARAEKGLVPLEIPDLEQWIALGRPLERDLFPEEFHATSAGSAGDFRRNSASLPPEADDKRVPSGDSDSAATDSGGHDSGAKTTSAGTKQASSGKQSHFHRNATDLPPEMECSSAGIPPENTLKGNEQNGNERRGTEVNIIVGGITPREGDDDPTIPKDAAEWIRYFADRHGVEIDPTNIHERTKAFPLFAAWTNAGITRGRMTLAVAKARAEAKTAIAFLPAYVDRVLATMDEPPKPPRESPEERRRAISRANGDAWLAEDPASDPNVIDMEH